MTHAELEDCPVYIGELQKPFGLNGFELAQVGHPVFSYKERYIIFLQSLTKSVEQVPDGKGGHNKQVIDFNVVVPFYKKTLHNHIKFSEL